MPNDHLRGRMIDLDSHLMLDPGTLGEILGPGPGGLEWPGRDGGRSVLEEVRLMMLEERLDPSRPEGLQGAVNKMGGAGGAGWKDDEAKEWGAVGAHVAADRVAALDQMGIARQLVFAQFMESAMYADGPEAAAAVGRYNDYVLEWEKDELGRVLPVCVLNLNDVGVAVAEARRVVERGARVVQLPHNLPPARQSPGAPEWDPLWALLAEAGALAVLHQGGTGPRAGFLNRDWYAAAHALAPPAGDPSFDDFHARPFFWLTGHLAAEVLVTFMVLGGVFERHPGLRLGIIELGASWVASWCERLDTIAATTSTYLRRQLSLRPSEYVRRQVRVTPYAFEPVGSWIERSGLGEVYAFSTDYPHREGGVDPIGWFEASLAPLGTEVLERFFVTNAAEIMPA